MPIIITNCQLGVRLPEVETLAGEWKLHSDLRFVKPDEKGEYLIDFNGLVNKVNYTFNKPSVAVREPYEYKFKLSPERFELWKAGGCKPMHLLLLLITDAEHSDQLEHCIRTNTDIDTLLIKLLLPNLHEADGQREHIKVISEVLGMFSWHPLVSNQHSDLYKTGYVLTIGYLLDAAQHFIMHGGSIGSSWLDNKGMLYALALQLYLDQTEGE